jgi:ACS family hexuronate transporter-like MFS transporter
VVGIGGMIGALGGTLFQAAAGVVTDLTGSYQTLFVVAASVYLLAVLIIHGLVPNLGPADLAPRSAGAGVSPT